MQWPHVPGGEKNWIFLILSTTHQGTTWLITGASGQYLVMSKKRVHLRGLRLRGLKVLEKLWKENIFCSIQIVFLVLDSYSWEHEQRACVCMCVNLVLLWGAPEGWGRRSIWFAKGWAEETPQCCGDIKQILQPPEHQSRAAQLPYLWAMSLSQPLAQVPSNAAWNLSVAFSQCLQLFVMLLPSASPKDI